MTKVDFSYNAFQDRLSQDRMKNLVKASGSVAIIIDHNLDDARFCLDYLFTCFDELESKSFLSLVVFCERSQFTRAKRVYKEFFKSWHVTGSDDSDEALKNKPILFVDEISKTRIPVELTFILSPDPSALVESSFSNAIGIYISDGFKTIVKDSLTDFRFPDNAPSKPKRSSLCKSRQEYYARLVEEGSKLGILYQVLEEQNQGCEKCPFCDYYKENDPCPFFQLKLAEFYDKDEIVPKNEKLSFQWKKKVATRGYKDAEIALADALAVGNGCIKDIRAALSIYDKFAISGDKDSAKKFIAVAEDSADTIPLSMPWIARFATEGDFEMQNKIIQYYNCFPDEFSGIREAEMGKWIELATKSGNASYISELASSSIENKDWPNALKWYGKLKLGNSEEFVQDTYEAIFDFYCEELSASQLYDTGNRYYYGLGTDEDYGFAITAFKKCYDLGDPRGAEGLGRCRYEGKGFTKNREAAIEDYFTPAAEAGEVQSIVQLYDYYHGESKDEQLEEYWKKVAIRALDDGVAANNAAALRLKSLKTRYGSALYPRDQELSFHLMKTASELGDPEAQFYLGQYYCHGNGVDKDYETAFSIFKKSADQGWLGSQRCMGCCYKKGQGVKASLKNAMTWYKKAGNRGRGDCCYAVGQAYEEGTAYKKNLEEANKWYIKAAEAGYSGVYTKLGENYYWGNGVEKNLSEAKKWSVLAAEEGYKNAYFRAAYLCARKVDKVTEYDKALKWYQELADAGNAAAINNLAVMYANGRGVKQDAVKASELFLLSAQKGDSMAMKNIASRYLQGTGIEVDTEQGVLWYRKSLDSGLGQSGNELAKEYLSGERIDKDVDKAIECYEKVLSLPHEDEDDKEEYITAAMALGNLYYWGEEVDEDNEKALEYYNKAAAQGSVDAYCKLGDMYFSGYGVTANRDKSIYWFRLAAELGSSYAMKELDEMGVDYLQPALPF